MSDVMAEATEKVACPSCDAPPGEACAYSVDPPMWQSGDVPGNGTHPSRVALYRESTERATVVDREWLERTRAEAVERDSCPECGAPAGEECTHLLAKGPQPPHFHRVERYRDRIAASLDDAVMCVSRVSCRSCRAEPNENCIPHAFKHQCPWMENGVHTVRIDSFRAERAKARSSPQLDLRDARSAKDMVSRIFDFLFGPDTTEKVDEAIDDDERHAAEGVASIRKADYTVEVIYDEDTQLFNARLRTKVRDLDIDAEGATPGEALTYAGMLIDSSLVRRGFRKG